MFITNFSLAFDSQKLSIITFIVGTIGILVSFYVLFAKKNSDGIPFVILFIIYLIFSFPLTLKPNEYKLTIAYVNVNDTNKAMTKDVAINTLLNDGIYPKYNIKYKTEKETFKLTEEEYDKLSKIYYDDLNHRRWIW